MKKEVYKQRFCFQDKHGGSTYISPRLGCLLPQTLQRVIGVHVQAAALSGAVRSHVPHL